ncbi:MAG: tRNA pseudouridine(13) synthase TruD [Desulfuromonadales bacterium]|nr:tRNA pseudouridine(13) synthase TruD [Desulfuromonadales bacterium]
MARYLTERFPGTGGLIKQSPEDFFVEEIPLYLPCGEGEHLYLTVEKQGITTLDLLQRLARQLGVAERELGYAGLKDARATTRQTISVPGVTPEQVRALELPGVLILEARRHRNKLRTGHLAGNRFRIRVRAVAPGALEHARDSLHVLQNVGVPNRFGEQRYGSLDNSHWIGRALLRGEFEEAARQVVGDPATIRDERWRQGAERFRDGDLAGALAALPGRCRDERRLVEALRGGRAPREALLGLPRKLLRLYLSAYQSKLFDQLLEMRLDTLDVLWAGDLAFRHDNGACFFVEDPAVEQPRADRLEISPSAPLFGCKVTLARGHAGILEESLLAREELPLAAFRLPAGLSMEGERRPLRVPLREAQVEQEREDLLFSFVLPKGSYATSVLREIIKPDAA